MASQQTAFRTATAFNPAVLSMNASARQSATPKVAGDHNAQPDWQAIGTVCHFVRNETVFAEGDNANYSYKIVSGAVRLCKLMADGRRHIAGFPLAGDFFGMEWTSVYALTAEAISDVIAIRYSRSHLDRLGDERADVRGQLMARLRQDLCAAQAHMVSLGCQTAKERVVSFLLVLATRSGKRNGDVIPLAMGRQDIADHLGLTIETVCRTLTDLKSDGHIAIPNRHEVVLRNVAAMRALADADA
jgi:CRP/FNR family nitrogen fixation transcriptional regulator